MKLNRDIFFRETENEIQSIYTFFADESIQITELSDHVIKTAKKNGFEEKQTFIISKDTDWSFLETRNENFDLFGSKKIIEIKLIGIGPGNKGSKAIKEYCANPDENKLLIISAERLEKKAQTSVWAKSLEDIGTTVIESPIHISSMPKWISKKASDLEIEIDQNAINLLSEKTEGNLLATTQELMKLSLLFPSQIIDFPMMEKSISNSSSYGIFDLSNAFVVGDKKKTIKIIELLKSEGTQPPLILWALSKEIYNLYKVVEEGSSKNIWGPRHYLDLLSQRAKRISRSKIKSALQDIAEIDTAIKGLSKDNPWQSIRELALNF
tara:strand:- start:3568 stop:4539 length:972 start_codon:yes stop_codon:yes gene_type:complete